MTRVLFIKDDLYRLGGSENIMLRIVDQLPRDRFSPEVLTFALEPSLDLSNSLACPLHVWPLRRTYDSSGFSVARRIRELVHSHKISITHTFHETSDLWAGMIAKLSGCPILVSSRRDMGLQRGAKHHIGYRLFGGYFDEVHTVSETVREFCIRKDGLSPSRVRTVYNGVTLPRDPDRNAGQKRECFGLPAMGPLVVSVGHVRDVKGFDIFLETARRVLQNLPDAVFGIAGEERDAALSQELRERARGYGIEGRFRLLGPVADIPALLYASDAFCLLSRTEGLSNALLEAMACGLPCVATRVGGNPEVVVEGRTGFLVENGDSDAAAARVLELLRDRPLAVRMGAAGRRVVEDKFTTEAMMRTVIDSYDRLLQSRGLR